MAKECTSFAKETAALPVSAGSGENGKLDCKDIKEKVEKQCNNAYDQKKLAEMVITDEDLEKYRD